MTLYMENGSLCLNECLNYPLSTRCAEMARLIDCGSIKDLHDFFPVLVKSIFGYPGWGLRTITRETAPMEFEYVYSFFVPLGPMFRLCYRLLSEPMKFDVPIELLPPKSIQMLSNGRYSVFYSDILNFDPYRRQVASLQLNAFDYFILHFVLHGMPALHKEFPAALTVHNDHLKTVYYFLTADYLCTFLPTDPNSEVQPSNVYCTVKSAATVPISPIVPMRRTKYLSRNVISDNFATTATNIRATEPSRSSNWRTESVLHLFVDTWLRYDVDGIADLPSSEFIQVVRVLVKQLHSFANSAEIDVTPMASLRSLAQPMMNGQINNFLRGIIQRWPLDSSFLVVMELWLSYIQPWRYTLNRQIGIDDNQMQLAIPQKFEKFVMENAASYTQIFIQLLPRFQRFDFTSLKNVTILYRLARVYGQSNLAQHLRVHDRRVMFEHLNMSPNKSSNLLGNISVHSNQSQSSPALSPRISHDVTDSFDSSPHSTSYFSHPSDLSYPHEDDTYVCLFGSTGRQRVILSKLELFKNKLFESYECSHQLINQLEASVQKRYNGFFGYVKWYLTNDEEAEYNQTLNDARKISEVLEFAIRSFAIIFEEELPSFAAEFNEIQQRPRTNISINSPLVLDDTSILELSQQSQRKMMLERIRRVQYSGDPLTLPARNNEIEFLVRLFYRLSHRLNQIYAVEIERFYRRPDFVGQICRVMLESPRTVQTFEKSHGCSQLIERQLRPRINLRWLASYRTIILIMFSLFFGKLLFGGSFFGFVTLIILKVMITLLIATYEMWFKTQSQ